MGLTLEVSLKALILPLLASMPHSTLLLGVVTRGIGSPSQISSTELIRISGI